MSVTSSSVSPDVDAADRTASAVRHPLLGAGLALLSAVGFSCKSVLVKLAYRHGVDALTLLTLRMVFSVPVFVLAALFVDRRAAPIGTRDRWLIVLLGVLGYYLSSLFDFMGLQHISAGLERLILFLYPTMVMGITAVMARRLLTRSEVLAMLLCYAGIALVFVHDLGTLHAGIVWGALLVFTSALCYSAYLIGAGQVIARVGAMRFTAYALLVASAVTVLQFVLTHPLGDLLQGAPVYGLSLTMALFSTVLPVFLLSAAIRLVGSGRASLIGSVGPVSTIFMAWLFLGEAVTLLQMAGSALVLAGVMSISLRSN